MESKYTKSKIALLYFIFSLISCSSGKEKLSDTIGIDTNIFEHGDIVCRMGNGFFSNWFRNFASSEMLYSHVGIIEISNDSVFVIHTEASELTGIGFVKKEEIHLFLHNIHTWGLYRINAENLTKQKIVSNAYDYYLKKVPFDMDFDLTNDSKVYCTELIAYSINKAFKEDIIKPTLVYSNKVFYGIEDIYLNPAFSNIHKVTKN